MNLTALINSKLSRQFLILAVAALIATSALGQELENASINGFNLLMGLLSLSGMLLKNGIVLLDQINTELHSGKDPYKAIIDSGVSRVRPVSMAAITTILGMVPLLADAFFESMAVTIMFGLGFATILTLIVVPVLYAMFHRIKYRPLSEIS